MADINNWDESTSHTTPNGFSKEPMKQKPDNPDDDGEEPLKKQKIGNPDSPETQEQPLTETNQEEEKQKQDKDNDDENEVLNPSDGQAEFDGKRKGKGILIEEEKQDDDQNKGMNPSSEQAESDRKRKGKGILIEEEKQEDDKDEVKIISNEQAEFDRKRKGKGILIEEEKQDDDDDENEGMNPSSEQAEFDRKRKGKGILIEEAEFGWKRKGKAKIRKEKQDDANEVNLIFKAQAKFDCNWNRKGIRNRKGKAISINENDNSVSGCKIIDGLEPGGIKEDIGEVTDLDDDDEEDDDDDNDDDDDDIPLKYLIWWERKI